MDIVEWGRLIQIESITQTANEELKGKEIITLEFGELNGILKLPKCLKLCHFVQTKTFHGSIACKNWTGGSGILCFLIDTETEVQENKVTCVSYCGSINLLK